MGLAQAGQGVFRRVAGSTTVTDDLWQHGVGLKAVVGVQGRTPNMKFVVFLPISEQSYKTFLAINT